MNMLDNEHAVTTVRDGNDAYLRCSCGKEMSTYSGADRHHLDVLTAENERLNGVIEEHHRDFLAIDAVLQALPYGATKDQKSAALFDIRQIVRPNQQGDRAMNNHEVKKALADSREAVATFDAGMPIAQPYRELILSAGRVLNEAIEAMSDQVQDHAKTLERIKTAHGYLTGVFGTLADFYEKEGLVGAQRPGPPKPPGPISPTPCA